MVTDLLERPLPGPLGQTRPGRYHGVSLGPCPRLTQRVRTAPDALHQHSIQRRSSVHAALTGTGDSGVIGDVTSYITDYRLSLKTRHSMSPVLASPTPQSIGRPVRITEWIDVTLVAPSSACIALVN